MLLTFFAFGIGCVTGRLRGGKWSGISSARFHKPGLLVLGIATVLVLNVIGPAFPLLWAVIGMVSFFWFGLRNLQITGMIVMLIGLLMNLAPLLANGAMPVSELALVSVGDVDENGQAQIEGLRESTDSATALGALGDVIPVPVFNTVVSIGDIVMLVALADIAANLFLRARRREELDDAGITFVAEDKPASTLSDRAAILSPLSKSVTGRPAHAAHRRPRRKAAPSSHVPAHAKESSIDLTDPETVIVLDGADAYVEQPPAPMVSAGVPMTEIIPPPAFGPSNVHEDVIDLTTIDDSPTFAAEEDLALELDEILDLTDDAPTDVADSDNTTHLGDSKDSAAIKDSAAVEQSDSLDESTADQSTADQSTADQSTVDEPTVELDVIAIREGQAFDEAADTDPAPSPEPATTVASHGYTETRSVDRRPIIDLTISPTDEQLQEFLRRRAEADAELLARTAPGPKRRGRSPRRRAEVAEFSR